MEKLTKEQKKIKGWAVIGINGKPYTCNCHNEKCSMYWILKTKKEAKHLKDVQNGIKVLFCEIILKDNN